MRISYDREVDALYIWLIEGEQQCRAVRLQMTTVAAKSPGHR